MVTLTAETLRSRQDFGQGVKRSIQYWTSYLLSKPNPTALATDLGSIKSAIRYAQAGKSSAAEATTLLMAVFPTVLSNGGRDWIQYYEKASRASSSNAQSLLLYQTGSLCWSHGKTEQAKPYFTKGFRLAKTKNIKAMNAIGDFLCRWTEGKREEAEKPLVVLLKMIGAPGLSAPIRARIHHIAGLAEFVAKKYENALKHFELAVQVSQPRDEQIHLLFSIGLCHQAQGRHKVALKAYTRAAKLLQNVTDRGKELARIEILRASIHYQKRKSGASHRLKPALAALSRAAEKMAGGNERDSRAILEEYLGKTYSRTGDVQRGIVYLNSALSLSRESEDKRLFAEVFRSLAQLEQKSPAGL